jgi:hypothetical protein
MWLCDKEFDRNQHLQTHIRTHYDKVFRQTKPAATHYFRTWKILDCEKGIMLYRVHLAMSKI